MRRNNRMWGIAQYIIDIIGARGHTIATHTYTRSTTLT